MKHPVQTTRQVYDALNTLARLVREDEWGVVAQTLSPEIHELVTQWDTLSSSEKGEKGSFAFGKCGADIFTPGAVAKVGTVCVKGVQEFAVVAKNLKMAQQTLVLETASGIKNTAKIAEVIEIGQRTARIADELGFTAQEIGKLKQAGQLEATVKNTIEHLSLPAQESAKLFEKAAEKLLPHQGKYMPESQIRELIHETGVPTFYRPKGIPESYRVKLSDKGAGMKYVHPADEGTYIRVMPGSPHSSNPSQQKPYVNQRINGQSLNKKGEIVSNKSPEAHIPLEEFVYRDGVYYE